MQIKINKLGGDMRKIQEVEQSGNIFVCWQTDPCGKMRLSESDGKVAPVPTFHVCGSVNHS